ncbi:hypothetical protein KFL_000260350 [Klebsormidium nitens]|uniref:Uncharacterized protein n=1 Tax=Klebsormidium nitens TaxID=105231 RepID=A0A1Y1HTQ5_KLENI|nr:hypothetical protein KFL_000260350 [Klebsormidium nitens]|eukprot:GAQ79218.1 hypothetical protein KFL_000260350 [Klebsormidium nitens]
MAAHRAQAQAAGGEGQTKLVDLCSGALLKKIGANADKLTATFCYGGAVDIPLDGLKLFYMQTKNDQNQAKILDIPVQRGREEDFLDLLSACEVATFGRRKEDVLDPSYRKALKLGKDYSCTFNLSEYSILSEVQRVMAPDALGIRAELHKLNVYRQDSSTILVRNQG